MIATEVIEELVERVFMERRHVQPYDGGQGADLTVINPPLQAKLLENIAAVVVDRWNHDLTTNSIPFISTAEKVLMNHAVIKRQIVVQLG